MLKIFHNFSIIQFLGSEDDITFPGNQEGSLVISVGQGIGNTSHHLLKVSLQLRSDHLQSGEPAQPQAHCPGAVEKTLSKGRVSAVTQVRFSSISESSQAVPLGY